MKIIHDFFKKVSPDKIKVPYKKEPKDKYYDEHEDCYTQSHGCLGYDDEYNTHMKHQALNNESTTKK